MDTTERRGLGASRRENGVAAAVEAAVPQTTENDQRGHNGVTSKLTPNSAVCSKSVPEQMSCEQLASEKQHAKPGPFGSTRSSVPINKKEDALSEHALVAQQPGSPGFLINGADTRKLSQGTRRGGVQSLLGSSPVPHANSVAATDKCTGINGNQNESQLLDNIRGGNSVMHRKPTVSIVPIVERGSRLLDTATARGAPIFLNCPPSAMSINTIQDLSDNDSTHSDALFRHDPEDATWRGVAADDSRDAPHVGHSVEIVHGELPSSIVSELRRMKHHGCPGGHRESTESATNAKTPSPMLVTMIGAGINHRRKHIKLRVAIKSYKYRRSAAPASASLRDGVAASPLTVGSRQLVARPPIPDFKRRHGLAIQRMLENEVRNLQRFHCPNIIRGIDIFTRYGKDYVVLPIAICNLDQLVRETVRYEFRQRQHQPNAEASLFSGQGSVFPDGGAGSEMVIDASCASYMSVGEVELSCRTSTVGNIAPPFFSAEFVRAVMYQLLHGVAYLHNQGLAHNDLKPQNILLFANGELKISDLGSVLGEYNDQGTPMYVSPEVCKYFYCAEDVEDEKHVVKVDALKNDMWSCGVILYYLLVGKPLWGSGMDARNKYQLYREIASQASPINLDHVPEPREATETPTPTTTTTMMMMDGSLGKGNTKSDTSTTKELLPSSLRHLLSRLLDIDPATRLSAKEAIEHPSLRALQLRRSSGTDAIGVAQRDVAFCVSQSPHLQLLIQRDRERHLQFVAECCSMLNIALPKEIFLPGTGQGAGEKEPIEDTDIPPPQAPTSSLPGGTVDRSLFPTEAEYDYYETKLGRAEHDLRFLLHNHAKVNMLRNYMFGTVLVECGYRSAEEAEAQRVRDLQTNQMKLMAAEQKKLIQGNNAGNLSDASNPGNIERDHCFGCLCGLM